MLIIDGNEKKLQFADFANLETLLDEVVKFDNLEKRVITDVLVNDEPFSEIYPHQAEDIEMEMVDKVEIISIAEEEMIKNILIEMQKVITIMQSSSKQIAELFRQADDSEALEMYSDLLDVVRNFLGMISILYNQKNMLLNQKDSAIFDKFSELLNEIIEVQDNQDWILMADLLEYEFNPLLQEWQTLFNTLNK